MNAVRRVFLGWEEPVCEVALRHLRAQPHEKLAATTVVVSTDRARLVFLRHLADLALHGGEATAIVVPPSVSTLRDLPESLYRPVVEIASELEVLLAWSAAIEGSPASRSARAFGELQDRAGADRWALSRQLFRLQDDLAEEDLRFRDVPAKGAERLEGFPEGRWQALCEMEEHCLGILDGWGRQDALGARREALAHGRFVEGGPVALVAIDDLSLVTARLLESCSRPIEVLVSAPQGERELFDDWGRPRPSRWVDRRLPLGRATVRIVDRPLDQAREVELRVSDAGTGRVSVAVGDSAIWGRGLMTRIERCLDLSMTGRSSSLMRTMRDTAPHALLVRLSRYLERRRLEDLCALIRDPDLEGRLTSSMPPIRALSRDRTIARCLEDRDWLTLLDLYSTETLKQHVGESWPGDAAAAEAVLGLSDTMLGLLQVGSFEEAAAKRSLGEQSLRLAAFLESVYGDRELVPGEPADEAVGAALRILAEALAEQSEWQVGGKAGVVVTVSEAIWVTCQRVSERRILGEVAARGAEVELLEWREMLIDEAETAVVAGLNEGSIPARAPSGDLLSEALRGVLGLRDAARRYARDLFLLNHLLMSRSVTLISGRRDAEDDPLVPSRLLLACESRQLPRTVLEFYGSEARQSRAAIVDHAPVSAVGIPRPTPREGALFRFSVTSFRDYLSCPYRFYLKHVLRLSERRDLPAELSPASFGALAHEVLRRFALGAAAASGDSREVRGALERLLERVVDERLGSDCRVAARIQVEQLRRRLGSFAVWQAEQVAEGWQLDPSSVELAIESSLVVDGEEVLIRGRIDRVDRHPEHGVRVVDYKTGERARGPERAHFRRVGGERVWQDLQLPLYRFLFGEREKVAELGFVNLTQDLGGEVLSLASWGREVDDEALEVARSVVRRVRRQEFWPPAEPPSYDDGLRRLAGDLWEERASLMGGV